MKLLGIMCILIILAIIFTFFSTSGDISNQKKHEINITATTLSANIYTGMSYYTNSDVFLLSGNVKQIKTLYTDFYIIFDCGKYPDIWIKINEDINSSIIEVGTIYKVRCMWYKNINEINIFITI